MNQAKIRAMQKKGQPYRDSRVCDLGDWLEDSLETCFKSQAHEGKGNLEQDVNQE